MRILRLLIVVCALTSTAPLFAQSSSGTITGRVLDASAPVPGANVTLVRTDIREERTLVTPALGRRRVHQLAAGPYSLLVELAGFARLETTNLALSSSERSVGRRPRTQGRRRHRDDHHRVRTRTHPDGECSEYSAPIDANQITELPTRGRDVFGLMATLPGVVYDGRGMTGSARANSPASFSGTARHLQHREHRRRVRQRAQRLEPRYHGRHGHRRRGKGPAQQLSGGYGKAAAGVINIVTKSAADFQGSGYYYLRHEKLNATDFFERFHPKRPLSLQHAWRDVRRPCLCPRSLRQEQEQTVLFGAYEYRPSTVPNATRYCTVPTQAERNGDFNRSVGNASGRISTPPPDHRSDDGAARSQRDHPGQPDRSQHAEAAQRVPCRTRLT